MLFERKSILYPILISSALLLSACEDDHDDEHADSACNEGAKEVSVTGDRTLCVNLTAFKADAPFTAGFMAAGKTTHTVFVSDKDGTPVDIASDSIVTKIEQYPMMYMDESRGGHQHSAPYKSADTTAAEYGAYNFDIYYPMPSAMMDGTVMGDWEFRVKITDNGGTKDVDTDDVVHTVKFEPTVEMYMSTKAYRAVGKNENDKYKNAMELTPARQYSVWLESLGTVANDAADVKVYLTTEDMDHTAMSMEKVSSRAEDDHGDHSAHGDSHDSDMDSKTYPKVHVPMDMNGTTHTLTLHSEDGTTEVDVDTVDVQVSTDDGANWTVLMGGMTHDDMGYYSASVPMTAGDVAMLVQVTVNGNIMTNSGVMADGTDAEDMPALKFTATE